jgi:hypothetical protein
MPKENRFAGLGDAIGDETESNQPETAASESTDTADTERERSDESEETTDASTEGASRVNGAERERERDDEDKLERAEDGENEPEGSAPAFEFEATTAKSIYVRRTTLDQLDDAEFEVESLLRSEHDIRNLTGREFHDALVRIATDHPDEIVDAILETRNE